MSLKKKDLEIVYNLRWKHGSKVEDKKDMSIVAVYDIPSTTLNFAVFKSYLLKNSGTPEDDVNVAYIMDNGKKYLIQSQTDFQVALYAFRRKARAGEIINLLLERISDKPNHKNVRHSNDVETQSDNAAEQNSIVSTTTCCTAMELPPEWFIAGLAQLKKELKEELAIDVSNIVGTALSEFKSPFASAPPACAPREKRFRRVIPYLNEGATDTKDLIRALKIESKLEKLDRKVSKYCERRTLLLQQKSNDNGPISSDSEAGPSCRRSRSRDKQERKLAEEKKMEDEQQQQQQQQNCEEPKMDAKPVNVQTSVPHMLGGEIYLHQWDVQNTGQLQWTFMTQLEYTWGSKKLVPVDKTIAVPFLKPGEKGTISVRLRIPTESGSYECYWQFTHNGRKFGHWLGVQVVVDAFDLKGHSSVLETTSDYQRELEDYEKAIRQSLLPEHVFYQQQPEDAVVTGSATAANTSEGSAKSLYELVQEVSDELQGLRIGPANPELYQKLDRIAQEDVIESDCSWSSDQDSVDRKSEFVVVPVPECFVLDSPASSTPNLPKTEDSSATPSVATATLKKEQQQSFDDNNNNSGASSSGSIKLRDEELDNIVVITVPKDDQVKEGFIYVHVDGQKVLIPKNILKSEVVSAAQELERSPSASNSIGVLIDSNEGAANKSPTPLTASTIKKVEAEDTNTLDSVPPKNLEEPIVPQQVVLQREAVDLSTGSRENLECGGCLEEGPERSNYFEANNYMSHCSAAGSCYSEINSQAERQNRLFIFPQDVPGYEVVYPVLDVNDPNHPNLTSETFSAATAPPPTTTTHYNIPHPLIQNPFVEPVPNYQQTPEDLRAAPIDPGTEPVLFCGAAYQEIPQSYLGTPNAEPHNQHLQQPRAEEAARAPAGETPMAASAPVHILPETLVSGAANVASSAINTARTVINMIKPQAPGRWVNGHWMSSNPETPREANLQALAEMGFWNRDLNATLLARFNDDLNRVVAELVQ